MLSRFSLVCEARIEIKFVVELFGLKSQILPLEEEGGGLAGRIWDLGQGSDFSSAYKARPALPQPLSMKQSVSEISALL